MVIKSFLGETVAATLKQIRSDLGSKAVVLKTRGLNAAESGVGRRMVEITACLENPTIGALQASFSDKNVAVSNVGSRIEESLPRERFVNAVNDSSERRNTLVDEKSAEDASMKNNSTRDDSSRIESLEERYKQPLDMEEYVRRLEEKLDVILDRQVRPLTLAKGEEYSQQVSDVGHALLTQDIQDCHVRPLLIRLSEKMNENPSRNSIEIAEQMLADEFAERCYPALPLGAGDRAVFVGPAGSGKTSILGKIAVKMLFKDKIKTTLATLDDFRVGAQEEIAGYSEALGATLVDIAKQSKTDVRNQNSDGVTLIDCHSNVNDQRQFARLQARIREIAPTHIFLVISALTRSADLTRLVRRFSAFNPTHLIVTHTDLTDTVGGIYTALKETVLPLVALSNAPGSIGELQTPDPAALARMALGVSRNSARKGVAL
ncbi:hypothetical protein JYT16_00870 [Gemmatimonas aurantiaca]|nr:hypothetical protein [Gemmatimonas aurantiaca]